MNSDPLNNVIHRRNVHRVYGPDSDNAYHDDRFNIDQYYNAVEDEQIYMDEYTSLVHRYNDFIMSGNAMFTRMEQTLRENLARTLVRQSYYFQHLNTRIRLRGSGAGYDVNDRVPGVQPNTQSQGQIPNMEAPAPINTMNAPPPPAPVHPPTSGPGQPVREPDNSSPQPQIPSNNYVNEFFPRLLSRYFSAEVNRNERQLNNSRDNRFSMLYTVPVALRTNNNLGSSGAPTNDQINRATLNTVFSHILSPVNAICPISRDEFNDDSEITMIRGCNHIFNRDSLREWFVSHSTCPMCRQDIRDYRPSSMVSESEQREIRQGRGGLGGGMANISIDHVDDNHITFSYDIPVQYTDSEIYRNIVDTITGMAQTSQPAHGQDNAERDPNTPSSTNQNDNNDNDENNNDDDILDVD